MSLTRKQWEEIWMRLKTIEHVNGKVWRAKHYKWANRINWEVKLIKEMVEQVIGQQK